MKSKATQFIVPCTKRAALLCSAAVLATLSGRNQALADPGQTNLALDAAAGGIATATSTSADFGSTVDAAIDGDRDGNFADGSVFYENSPSSEGTNSDPNATYFYTVNLGQNDYINRVQFLPRTDADQGIFGNFNISIYPGVAGPNNTVVPGASPSFSENYNTSYFGDTFATADPGNPASGGSSSGSVGQFVTITRLDNNYWMTFAEMEVIGATTPLQNTVANDVALDKPVTTSTAPGFGALITSGNDGNISGDLSAPNSPVYCTSSPGVGEFWQVDLGANTPLSIAELFCRDNVGQNTTSQFDLEVFNSAMQMVDSVIVNNNNAAGDFDHEINLSGITGEFLRLVTTQDQYLCFSEFEVFGASQTQQWASTGSGNWGDIDNWNGGTVPNSVGAEADFFNAINSNSTIVIDSSNGFSGDTVGTLHFNSPNTFAIAGTGTLTLQSVAGTTALIQVDQSTAEIQLPLVVSSNATLNVNSGANLVISNVVNIGAGVAVTQSGGGTVTYNGVVNLSSGASLSIGNPTIGNALNLASNASVTLSQSTGAPNVVQFNSLSLGSGAKMDVANNEFVLNYGNLADPVAMIGSYLASGYNGGAWNGAGIYSSVVASANASGSRIYAVGYADGADGIVNGLPSGEIEIKPTLAGDATLSGTVSFGDFQILAANFGKAGGWDAGNFTYGSIVDFGDFQLLAGNFGASSSAVTAGQLASLDGFAAQFGDTLVPNADGVGFQVVSVPEPASLSVLALMGLCALRRRRRN